MSYCSMFEQACVPARPADTRYVSKVLEDWLAYFTLFTQLFFYFIKF